MTTTTTMILTSLPERLLGIADETMMGLVGMLFATTVLGFMLYIQQRIEWYHGLFESRVNISLNTIADGVLRIRALSESDVKDVILSPYARRLVKMAAKKTTLHDQFLFFKDHRDAWMVYNEVRNAISGLYGAEIVAAAMRGTGADEEQFFVGITWERDAEVRIQKLRVIVVQLSVLEESFPDIGNIRPEVPDQKSRIATLGKMYEQFRRGTWPEYQIVRLPRA